MESKDLDKMDLATLFGKLQEHEMELERLTLHEESNTKRKGISLKATTKSNKVIDYSSNDDDSESELNEESFDLLMKRFGKFFKNKGDFKNKDFELKDSYKNKSSKDRVKCHECGGSGHYKNECPTFLKKSNKTTQEVKGKRAYVVWEDSEKESSSSSSEDEAVNLCLMAKSNNGASTSERAESDDEVSSNYSCSSSYSISYDDLHQAYKEMLIQFKRLAKFNDAKRKKILEYQQEIVEMEKSLNELRLQNQSLEIINSSNKCDCANPEETIIYCEKCDKLEKEVTDLNNKLHTFSNSVRNLNRLLASQRNQSNRTGLGYVHTNRNKHKIVGSFSKINFTKKPTCFYCGKYGHTNNKCHIKKYGIPNGTYIWIRKGEVPNANPKGPNIIWVPKTKT